MIQWPELPDEGEFVRLPLALPPLLLDAMGYVGDARGVAIMWTRGGDRLALRDGRLSQAADVDSWLAYRSHVLGLMLLAPYELRSTTGFPEHALVADRSVGRLSVGRYEDVYALVGSQSDPAEPLAPAHASEASAGEQLARPAGTAATRAITRQGLRQWLDGCLGALDEMLGFGLSQSWPEAGGPLLPPGPPGPDGFDLS